ncbi:MAG: FAD-binding oxidoreductase [Gammaproteobacteria bacterium]|jgi:D-lactate dehydrogenase (cytochrome)|nr:FAD-binding oxidoreductase [Gammaproteobacteria bacterium]MDP6615919.1 FAD-binding oxidoreductase [Gammaproteobacteria bacterium]MDP6695042.1 FAD-binding oxidoreductase [Gammaproteobacteria bacterium]
MELDKQVLKELKDAAGASGWTDDPATLEPHLTEWRGLFRGATPIMLAPASTGNAAEILRICNTHRIPVVPQGGNTGLAGGAIPGQDSGQPQVLLSASRLRKVRETDTNNYTITVEAGCVLAEVQAAAARHGLFFPLSLAAEGSCQIGGNIATNAGGTNVLRYGNTRDLVLGLEVVLPDGSVFDDLSALRKDNTGYDLKQLFIGAEGTLGFITAATLKLFPASRSSAAAWLAVESPQAAVNLYVQARRRIGDELVTFELMPRIAIEMVVDAMPACRDPMDAPHDWYVLLEVASAREQASMDEQLSEFLAEHMEAGLVRDGVVAVSESQRSEFWNLRHNISEAQKHAGASIKHDISVPVSRMPEFLVVADERVRAEVPGIRPVPFGHLGDGNLHYNLSQPEGMEAEDFLALWGRLNEIVHTLAVDMDGSFSAEHGIGSLKVDEFERLGKPVELELMRSVKRAIDPHNIMNPGKVLRV